MLLNNYLYLVSGYVCIKVQSDSVDLNQKLLKDEFLWKYIPGLKLGKSNLKHDVEIKLISEKRLCCYKNYPNITIGCKDLSIKDIISLIEFVFERARQDVGVYCIHSSSVIYENEAYVFWGGATGMGKTILADTFIKNGAKFYSDEKTLIDLNRLEVVGGIPFQYLEKNYKNGLKMYNSSISKDGYKSIDDTGVINKNFKIRYFIYGYGIEGSKLIVDKWSPIKFEWHLYEELGRKIRAISRRVGKNQQPVPSIDSEKCAIKRVNMVNKTANEVMCIFIQGSPNDVINFIKKSK
jgi:hypothetical protein